MIIRFKRGQKSQGIPRGKLGEPLFQYDTGELYIGMGEDKDPVKISGISIYKQDTEPTSQKENDIWINTSTTPPKFYIYNSTDGWVQITEGQQVGELSDLMTKNKDTIVQQINELYSRVLGMISNFRYTILNDGTTIKLEWQNPNSPEFVQYELYVSETVDLLQLNRDECYSDPQITRIAYTQGTGMGNEDSYLFENAEIGKIYYFKIFQKFDFYETVLYSDGLYLKVKAEDVNPPDNLTDLRQVQLSNLVDLFWTNPANQDFAGIRLIRRSDRFPISEDDTVGNDVLVSDLTPDRVSYRDTLVENEKTYYYQLFPFDTSNNFNTNDQNKVIQKPSIYQIDDVSNFKQVSQNEGKNVLLTWVNPPDRTNENKFFHQREVYVSLKDLTTFTRDDCVSDNDVILIDNTVGTGQGKEDQILFDSSSYNVGDKLYFKIFTVYSYEGLFFYSLGVTTSTVLIDDVPPEQSIITNVVVLENSVKFNINDQVDEDWAGQYIVKKYGTNPPTSYQDYDYRWVYNIKNQYSTVQFVDDNVQIGENYTYKVFQFDQYNNINTTGNSITITVTPDVKQVSNFKQSTLQENTVQLSWLNPSEYDYPEWQGTVIVRKQGSEPTDVSDGITLFETTDRNISQFTDTSVQPSLTYYYRQFTYELVNGERVYNIDNKRVVSQIPFQIPPSDVSNVKIFVNKYDINSVYFSWSDPKDNDWYFTRLVRKEGNEPENHTDGVLVYTNNELDKYKDILFSDVNLNSDTSYFYGLFPQDNNFNYNYNYKTGEIKIPSSIDFTDVSQITPSTTDDGTTLVLNWNEPISIPNNYSVGSYYIFISKDDISNYSFKECYNNDYGKILYRLITNQTTIQQTGLEVGQQYYIKIFTVFLNNETTIQYLSEGITISYTMVDIEPPDTVSNFTITQGDREQYITWTDPDDPDWYGTLIVRKKESEPVDENDGTIIVNSTIKNAYQTNKFVDSELYNGVTYYYKQITYDKYGNYNRSLPQVSVTPYVVQKYPELENEVTLLNVQEDQQFEIKRESGEGYTGTVDVLKQDYTGFTQDITKTLQQFKFDDNIEINEHVPDDPVSKQLILKEKRINEIKFNEVYTNISDFINSYTETYYNEIINNKLLKFLKYINIFDPKLIFYSYLKVSYLKGNYILDQEGIKTVLDPNVVPFDDILFITQSDWVNNHYLTDLIKSLPDGGNYQIFLDDGIYLDIDGTWNDKSERLINKNITIIGNGYNTKLGLSSSTDTRWWTLFPNTGYMFRFVNIHFLDYGYTPITSADLNPQNTKIEYINCIFNGPNNVGSCSWGQSSLGTTFIFRNVFYRVIYYYTQQVYQTQVYDSIEYSSYGFSRNTIQGIKSNTVNYAYNFDSLSTPMETVKNQFSSYTANNQGPFQGYFPMDLMWKIIPFKNNKFLLTYDGNIYQYNFETHQFENTGISINQIDETIFEQYSYSQEEFNSILNDLYINYLTPQTKTELTTKNFEIPNVSNIDEINLTQDFNIQTDLNISNDVNVDNFQIVTLLPFTNSYLNSDSSTIYEYDFSTYKTNKNLNEGEIMYFSNTIDESYKFLFLDTQTGIVKFYNSTTQTFNDLNTPDQIQLSDFETYGINIKKLNEIINNIPNTFNLVQTQDLTFFIIISQIFISEPIMNLQENVSKINTIVLNEIGNTYLYLLSFDNGNTWKRFNIETGNFEIVNLEGISYNGNTADEISQQLSNYSIQETDTYLKVQVIVK